MIENLKNWTLLDIYQQLLSHYGPQHWWPAEEPFEVIVGAILTQSTAWTNVEKSIAGLKMAGALSPSALRELPDEELAGLIHSCGYYNMKAVKLKSFAAWFGRRFNDSLPKMELEDLHSLRVELLSIYGVGEETADSILLYACNKPIFVIDAYTRRIVDRLGFHIAGRHYADYQKLFMSNLPLNVPIFNEYHALLVALGKNSCRKTRPFCEKCCVKRICPFFFQADRLS